MKLSESEVGDAALDWLAGLGWSIAHGPDIAPGTPDAERTDYIGGRAITRRVRTAAAEPAG